MKKNIIILGICIIILLLAGITYAASNPDDSVSASVSSTELLSIDISEELSLEESSAEEKIENTGKKVEPYADYPYVEINDEMLEKTIRRVNEYLGTIKENNEYKPVEKFTEEQRIALGNVYLDGSICQIKKVMEILGRIDKDLPLLTWEQVKEICLDPEMVELKSEIYSGKSDTPPYYLGGELMRRLNEIAGAPNTISYAGFGTSYRYYLNESGTEYIQIYDSGVYYGKTDADTGKRVEESLYAEDIK